MSYTILFEGSFLLNKPLEQNHRLYLQWFSQTRRVKWFVEELENIPDPTRVNVGLPLGPDGAYFLGREPHVVDWGNDPLIKNENQPPHGQPGLWCLWIPSDDGKAIMYDSGESSSYREWLYYLIEHFLRPWSYVLSGKVDWEIPEHIQRGTIVIEENVIQGFDVAQFERRLALLEYRHLIDEPISNLERARRDRNHPEYGQPLTEADCLRVLEQEIEKRERAIVLYKQGNSLELVAKEQQELDFLQTYLLDSSK